MTGVFLLIAGANALVVTLVTWVVAARYGLRAGLVVPVLGVVAVFAVTWRNAPTGDAAAMMGLIATALMIAWPWMIGAAFGLTLAWLRSGR